MDHPSTPSIDDQRFETAVLSFSFSIFFFSLFVDSNPSASLIGRLLLLLAARAFSFSTLSPSCRLLRTPLRCEREKKHTHRAAAPLPLLSTRCLHHRSLTLTPHSNACIRYASIACVCVCTCRSPCAPRFARRWPRRCRRNWRCDSKPVRQTHGAAWQTSTTQRRMPGAGTRPLIAGSECGNDLIAVAAVVLNSPAVSELAASFQTGSAYTSAYRTLVTMLKPRADTLARQKNISGGRAKEMNNMCVSPCARSAADIAV